MLKFLFCQMINCDSVKSPRSRLTSPAAHTHLLRRTRPLEVQTPDPHQSLPPFVQSFSSSLPVLEVQVVS